MTQSFVSKTILIEEIIIYILIHMREETCNFPVCNMNLTLTIFQKRTKFQMFDTRR